MHSRQGYVLLGFVPLIWFGALHQAFYDYWTMTLAFGWISGLAVLHVAIARQENQPLKFPLLTSWIMLVAAGWLSVMHSFDTTTSLWEAWGWTFCMVAFYIVVNCSAAAPGMRRFFLVASGSVVVPLTWAALHQQIYGSPATYGDLIVHGRSLWHYGHWEIHASLVNSIVLAGFLMSWGFTFWPLAAGRSRFNGILFFILVCGIFLSRSWTAIFCLAAGLALYQHRLYGTLLNRAFFTKILLAACGAAAIMVFWKWRQPAEGQHYVSSMRLVYWKAATRMFLTHPLTGIGLGGYAVAFPYFKQAAGENTLLAHGVFWQLLAETGLVGILACAIGLAEFSNHAKNSSQKKAWPPEDLSLYMTLVTLLVFGLTTIYFDYLLNTLTFVIMAGFLCAGAPTRMQWTLRPSATILIIAVFMAWSSLWLTLFRAEQWYAAGDYVRALELNPRLGDAWARLADAEKNPEQARRLRLTAWHWKKDRALLIANMRQNTP